MLIVKFELYQVTVSRAQRQVTGFVVAPDPQRAEEIVIANELALNEENRGFTLERVDETLPPEQRKGLVSLLEGAPAGLASYCEPIGWIAHAIPAPKLHLYRIEELEGETHFVIAPTFDVAVVVYCDCIDLEEGEGNIFNVQDGTIGLKNEGLRGLPALLEFGPIGLVHWQDETGWSLK